MYFFSSINNVGNGYSRVVYVGQFFVIVIHTAAMEKQKQSTTSMFVILYFFVILQHVSAFLKSHYQAM